MLELRPSCENCQTALPPESSSAWICSYECTFCSACIQKLQNVCPNCGGGFAPRPIRPAQNWQGNNYLGQHPPGTRVVHQAVDFSAHAALLERLQGRPPEQR